MGKSSVWKVGGTATGSRLLGIASRCELRSSEERSFAGGLSAKNRAANAGSRDGLLERDVTLRTGQTVCVPVVPITGSRERMASLGVAPAIMQVHDGVLGAHRSAEVTIKLLERAVWWPDLDADVKLWVSKCLACLKGRARPTKVEARAVKCSAETCWQESGRQGWLSLFPDLLRLSESRSPSRAS